MLVELTNLSIDKKRLIELCQRYGVKELRIFGSAALGTMNAASDIDFLVEFQPDAQPGLLDHAGLTIELSDLTGRSVDLVSKKALKPLLRDAILNESLPVYAA